MNQRTAPGVRVGKRRNGGEVWVQPKPGDPDHALVGVVELGGQAVDVTWGDIKALRDGLTRMLRDVGRE